MLLTSTVHNPLLLHPWRISGVVVVIWKVFGPWIDTPPSPGWTIVVYPASENLLTLPRFLLSPGTTIASLALLVSSGIGGCTFVVAYSVVSSGR